MKTKLAFTLIEIIIVITILVLVSSAWIMYFTNFVDDYRLEKELSLVKNQFEELDKQVQKKEILDYELHLNSQSNLFYVYKNVFDSQFLVSFDVEPNYEDASWDLRVTPDYTWAIWELKTYNKHKFLSSKYIDSADSETLNWYTLFDDYSFVSYLSWSRVNDIDLKYFSQTNIDLLKNNFLTLSHINTQSDWFWASINKIVLKNISWKKTLTWDSTKYDSLYLFFNRAWSESFIKLSKY